MAGKRKRQETLEELLERPWCYYCERDFDDLQVLSTHQREQHFHCESCNRRLNTASGLSVHTAQVHKDTVTKIRNALPGREDPGLEIFGMVGVPEDLLQAHRQSLIDGYYQLAAEHRARTGNPLPGTVKHDPTKKGKREETKEETLARLAAHRAKKQAEKEAAAQAATEATRPTQASPPTNNHATVGGSEGDDFIALESTSADALFPAQQYHQGFPNYAPDHAPQPMPAFSPPPYAHPGAGPVFPGYPMHGMPSYPQSQAPMAYPNSMAPQMSMPPQVSMPYSVSMPPQMSMPPQPSMSPPGNPPSQAPSSITPPASGLPQRPAMDAPNYSKAEFAKFHPQGSSQPSAQDGVTPNMPAPTPTMPLDPDLPRPYESLHSNRENGKKRITRGVYALHEPEDPSDQFISAKDAAVKLLMKKPTGQLAWIKLSGETDHVVETFEEIKAEAERFGFVFDESNKPTETVLAT